MPAADLPRSADVVVIGASIVGCACAYYLGQTGLTTCLLDRGPIGRGASGACEDNVILSDKRRGPLLDLAKSGQDLYRELWGADQHTT